MDADGELSRRAARAFTSPFGGVLRLESDGENPVFVDGRSDAVRVASDGSGLPAAGAGLSCWRGTQDALMRALESERAFMSAYVAGRVIVHGDMSVLARLKIGG